MSWDLDGTLYSARTLWWTIFKDFPRRVGRQGLASARLDLACIRRFRRAVERQRHGPSQVLPGGAREAEDEARATSLVLDALSQMSPSARALAWVERIARAGVPQVVLSDLAPEAKLAALGIEGAFSRAYSCQALGFWKPSPVPFQKIEAELQVLPQQHLHIGDRPETDGEGARRAGCRFVAFKG